MSQLQAWFMDDSTDDQRFEHRLNADNVSLEYLSALGVKHFKINPENYDQNEELNQLRKENHYDYMDCIECCPEKLPNYEQKIKAFFEEHLHTDDEIRFCIEGSGYFDVRDKDDKWIRILLLPGDLIVLPAGIYHRFTLDQNNYIKAVRLFIGQPVWTPHNRPCEEKQERQDYLRKYIQVN